jgi:hypothetical protein
VLTLAAYLFCCLLAVATSALGVPVLAIVAAVVAAVIVLRLELVWALGKLVYLRPIHIDQGPRKRPRHA